MKINKKNQAKKYFKKGDYEQAIKIYSELLLESDVDNHLILCNRSVTYIKLEKYDLALIDAVNTTKLKPNWGKAWGRLGDALYCQDKFDESLIAYDKANKLQPTENYTKMINQINDLLITKIVKEQQDINSDDKMNNLFSNLFDSLLSNNNIMNKLDDIEFQNKLLDFQNNPIEALKDNDIMSIMSEMMKSINY